MGFNFDPKQEFKEILSSQKLNQVNFQSQKTKRLKDSGGGSKSREKPQWLIEMEQDELRDKEMFKPSFEISKTEKRIQELMFGVEDKGKT